MKAVFVTGTDTGVGKTVVTGLLARHLSERGYRVITQKWIQTGSKDPLGDVGTHLKLMNKKRKLMARYLPRALPYAFKLGASAHLASESEAVKIEPARIKKSFKSLSKKFDFVIVEGIGGILVPLNRKKLVIDLAKELKLPLLIVTRNKLGTINHTLLTIEAARKRRMKILGIIFNSQRKNEVKIIMEDNPRIIKSLSGEKTLGNLPWSKNHNSLYRAFEPIGSKIFFQLVRKKNG